MLSVATKAVTGFGIQSHQLEKWLDRMDFSQLYQSFLKNKGGRIVSMGVLEHISQH